MLLLIVSKESFSSPAKSVLADKYAVLSTRDHTDMLHAVLRAFTRTDILFRYMLGGGLGAVIQFSILSMLHEFFQVDATISSAISFAVAVVANYSFQYYLTFRANCSHSLLFRRFVIVAVTGLAINTFFFWVLHSKLGLHYLPAQAGAIGFVFSFNYLMNYYYTFGKSTQ